MARAVTLDELRIRSARAGLSLSEEELQQILPGVNRSQRQVAELRALLSDEIEPANQFSLVSIK